MWIFQFLQDLQKEDVGCSRNLLVIQLFFIMLSCPTIPKKLEGLYFSVQISLTIIIYFKSHLINIMGMKKNYLLLALRSFRLRFSFLRRFLCHFHLICLFFFHLFDERFMIMFGRFNLKTLTFKVICF